MREKAETIANIYNLLSSNMGKRLRIKINEKEMVVSVPKERARFQAFFNQEFYEFIYKENVETFGIVEEQIKYDSQTLDQRFQNGDYNCVLKPIYESAYAKTIDSTLTKKTKSKYITVINKLNKLQQKYKNGVRKEDIPEICEILNVSIVIYPFYSLVDKNAPPIIQYRPSKPNMGYEYINTESNHVSPLIGGEIKEVDDLKPYENDAIIYRKYKGDVKQIITEKYNYKLKNEVSSIFKKFEEEYNLNYIKICSIKNKDLSNFIFSGCHDSYTYDFKYIERDTDERRGLMFNNDKLKPLINQHDPSIRGIDQIKAYTNFSMCNYYEGFPAKITDFRKTNKIETIGYYEIKNLKCSDLFKELGYEDGVYPSVELKFLQENGATFEIFQGCWGTDIKFEYPQYMLEKYNGISLYCLHAGVSVINTDSNIYYCNQKNKDLLGEYVDCYYDTKYCTFQTPKYTMKHLAHIYGFVYSYVRIRSIQMIQKIIKNNGYDSLVRVCKDGIYYTGEPVHQEGWSEDKTIKLGNYGAYYISPTPSEIEAKGEYKQFYKHSIHLGAGGTGKTHTNIIDKGNVDLLYLVTSHKLRDTKAKEYNNLHTSVSIYAIDNKTDYKKRMNLYKYNVLLFDECSMISESQRIKIIKNFPYHKILFVGDIQCQLPPIFNNDKDELIQYHKLKTFWYDTYYRFSGKLKDLQLSLRNAIISNNIQKFYEILEEFQFITLEELKTKYKKEDIILTFRKPTGEKYTEIFKDIEKYYINSNNGGYHNGDVLFTKPNICASIRHGYTVHLVQGETFIYNIYIDYTDMSNILNSMLSMKLIYTAITRARNIEQIYFIRN